MRNRVFLAPPSFVRSRPPKLNPVLFTGRATPLPLPALNPFHASEPERPGRLNAGNSERPFLGNPKDLGGHQGTIRKLSTSPFVCRRHRMAVSGTFLRERRKSAHLFLGRAPTSTEERARARGAADLGKSSWRTASRCRSTPAPPAMARLRACPNISLLLALGLWQTVP